MRLVYTGIVSGGEQTDEVRAYYERILPFYEKESRARIQFEFWRDLARRWRPANVLEIGAGLGHVTKAFGRSTFSVGMDISLMMLSTASRGLPRSSQACFIAADMRRRVFGSLFDLIVAPGDPFSHLLSQTDRKRALRAAAHQLSPRGRFVLEGLYRHGGEAAIRRRPIRHEAGVLSISEQWRPIGVRQLWKARYLYRDRRPGEADCVLEGSFIARAWDPHSLTDVMRSCGLQVERLWGDFDHRPFRADAERIIVVSRRLAPRGAHASQ